MRGWLQGVAVSVSRKCCSAGSIGEEEEEEE